MPTEYLRTLEMLWVVTFHGSVIGVYTSAVDSECVVRSLRDRGCGGAVVTEARLNAETETGAALLQEPG
jgi:hypothetical protein